jgi:hypothetical protein
MGLARIFPGGQGLGNLIVRNIGDGAGPIASRVESELDSLVAWAKLSPRITFVDVTDHANSGSGVTTIITVSNAAGTLAATGDFLEFVGEYDLVSAGVTKTITYSFGGQNLNANPWNNTLASTQITIIGRVYRVDSTHCRCYIACSLPFAGQTNPFTQFGDITVSNMDSNALDFVVKLQGTSSSDVTHRVSHMAVISRS